MATAFDQQKRNRMKQAQITEAVLRGQLIQGGEYLMSKAENIPYKDKKTGAAASFDKLTHTILTSDGAVAVEEDTRKIAGFDPVKYRSTYSKGQKVVVLVESKVSVRGVVTLRGKLEALEA